MTATDAKESEYQRVWQHAISRCPQLEGKEAGIIRKWLADGYSVERHIVPAISLCARINKEIYSFAYFTRSIMKFAAAPKQRKKPEVTYISKPVISNAARAQTIRWKRDRGLFVGDDELKWLRQHDEHEKSPACGNGAS